MMQTIQMIHPWCSTRWKAQVKKVLPGTSLVEERGASGWLSSFSISEDLLDLLFTKKKATIPPTRNMDMIIPAMPPAPIPDFLLPPPAPLPDGLSLPPDFWRPLWAGGVPGGGGGAGPEFQLLPSFLLRYSSYNFHKLLSYETIGIIMKISSMQMLTVD